MMGLNWAELKGFVNVAKFKIMERTRRTLFFFGQVLIRFPSVDENVKNSIYFEIIDRISICRVLQLKSCPWTLSREKLLHFYEDSHPVRILIGISSV